ncbi:MAG: NAD+ synthase [Candidatus Micrarchaeota archaeon]|nr:NAD+ synthase [Candidatus Micrarchaeota archaeon]
MDAKEAERRIVSFIRSYFKKAGKRKAVVGVSGGLDSAVTAALCAKAVGKGNVVGALLPSADTPKRDLADAQQVVSLFCGRRIFFGIEPALRALKGRLKSRLSRANAAARIRMAILYSIAHEERGLVVGTGDKSEILLGYFTKYGDGGADLFPIGGIYKTQLRELAQHLGIPKQIIAKPPSPALWKGQTAEGEMGFSYEVADAILEGVEKKKSRSWLEKKFGRKTVLAVLKRIRQNAHKRLAPPICEV